MLRRKVIKNRKEEDVAEFMNSVFELVENGFKLQEKVK